uniref:Uncharacterized protein n=1 Tax=Octactis speculum TaxID=3111310 RepID=A0A7S2BDL2_9STRA|mmetsp:Transcript_22224/g.30311  ORF Transcript_22224/g.30311 Transcript_22224/m.30311 type:complete len:132 (+) Transcript_22224:70-465(+)
MSKVSRRRHFEKVHSIIKFLFHSTSLTRHSVTYLRISLQGLMRERQRCLEYERLVSPPSSSWLSKTAPMTSCTSRHHSDLRQPASQSTSAFQANFDCMCCVALFENVFFYDWLKKRPALIDSCCGWALGIW